MWRGFVRFFRCEYSVKGGCIGNDLKITTTVKKPVLECSYPKHKHFLVDCHPQRGGGH